MPIGDCYFTDVTWDDDPNAERFGFINHKYFNLTFEEIRTDHIAFSTGTNGFSLPDSCNHTKYGYKYTDTGELGSGHFNDSTTPEEAAKHFKVIEVDGADVYWRCDFQFDGDAGEWISANKFQIGKILGGHAEIYGGFDGYGVLRYYCNNAAFTPTESISFAEPTVYLNNSHMRQQLSVNFTPANASYQDVTYTSSDSRIAKVDENGVVRAVSSGTATITATAVDGKTATCQVVVDHSHNAIRAVPAVTANCITKGNEAHYICDSCGTLFSDSKGKNTISLMDVVILPTSYCSYLHYDTYRNEEGHWKVCRLCGKWGTKQIIPHEDWTGDGICDSFSSDIQPCRYVMDPSATKPPQSTSATTKPAAKPTQPAAKPSAPTTSATQPPTQSPTESAPASTPPTTEDTPVTESGSVPSSTAGQMESLNGSIAMPLEGNTAPPAYPSVLLWIAVLIGVAAATIAVILILRRRKR